MGTHKCGIFDEINWDAITISYNTPTVPTFSPLKVKKVIFNDPATIIYWTDGSKTVVKCQNGEEFDPEKGFVMAYLKKLLGNKNEFNKEIHKWVKDV